MIQLFSNFMAFISYSLELIVFVSIVNSSLIYSEINGNIWLFRDLWSAYRLHLQQTELFSQCLWPSDWCLWHQVILNLQPVIAWGLTIVLENIRYLNLKFGLFLWYKLYATNITLWTLYTGPNKNELGDNCKIIIR